MSARYLIDSVILIDLLNGVAASKKWLEARAPGESVISAITVSEVMSGMSREEAGVGEDLLDVFEVLSIDKQTAMLAGRLRQEERWRLPDALQAALAHQHGLHLVTRNTKDFPPGKYSFVMVPYHV